MDLRPWVAEYLQTGCWDHLAARYSVVFKRTGFRIYSVKLRKIL